MCNSCMCDVVMNYSHFSVAGLRSLGNLQPGLTRFFDRLVFIVHTYLLAHTRTRVCVFVCALPAITRQLSRKKKCYYR